MRSSSTATTFAPFSLLVIAASLVLFCSGVHAEPANKSDTAQQFGSRKMISSLQPATLSKRTLYLHIFEQQAREQGVPAELVDAVAFVESAYNPNTMGSAGEIGIMQVMPSTAAMLGFTGNRAELAQPETNIRLGVEYLVGALRHAGGDLCRALMKYRAGHGEQTMSARSTEYCRRARDHLAALGSPLAASVSVPVPSDAARTAAMLKPRPPFGATPGTRRVTIAGRGRQFWAAHEARIRAMTLSVRAKWARLAQQKRG